MRRSGDDADRRRKLARLTPRGVEVLALSAMIFEDIRSRWAGTLAPAAWRSWNPRCGPWCPVRRSGPTSRAGSG